MIETLPSIAAINNNYKIIKYLYEEGYYFESYLIVQYPVEVIYLFVFNDTDWSEKNMKSNYILYIFTTFNSFILEQ